MNDQAAANNHDPRGVVDGGNPTGARDRLLAISRRELADRQVSPGEAHDILVALQKEEARAAVLASAVAHVLRYGKVGKQSEARLRAALRAVDVSRG